MRKLPLKQTRKIRGYLEKFGYDEYDFEEIYGRMPSDSEWKLFEEAVRIECHNLMEETDWERMTQNIEETYEELMAKDKEKKWKRFSK